MKIFRFNILVKKSQLRTLVLKWILYLSGFKTIRDHWLYIKDLKDNSIVIDLGANTGTFSKAIIKQFNSKCFAIEPNVKLFNNINTLYLTKLNYAITKEDGPIDFYLSENDEASSLINNFQQLWNVAEKNIVEGISWNSLIKKLKLDDAKIDVLKMDIEGAELDIIESFNAKNLDNIKQITVEFHHRLNPDLHEKTVQAIKKLLSFGFIGYANTISPVEILFLNNKYFKFNFFQKLLLGAYNKLSFSPY